MKAAQLYDYTPDTGRAERFAKALDEDPGCSEQIRQRMARLGTD